MKNVNWYQLETGEVLKRLKTDADQGLDAAEAKRRLNQHGYNEITGKSGRSPFLILWQQLTSTMVVILIIAAVISGLMGDTKDLIVISAIVVLNAILGFHQEYRAEKAIASLKKYAAPTVKIRRQGNWQEESARLLVPGDVILLEAGNFVPADGRLLETYNLRIQESAMTGESEPVEKNFTVLNENQVELADRSNMIHMGTMATYGRGIAVITETGNATELGHIATMIQNVDKEQTPLQRRMDHLGRSLAAAAFAIVIIFFAFGLFRGEELKLMFLAAVSLAVAAVPEGLPAVATITLSLGAQRMLQRHALIRKLPAVETLGSVTTICSDKTGTLTQNRMSVVAIDLISRKLDMPSHLPSNEMKTDLALLLTGSALCNDAVLQTHSSQSPVIGDPTETALLLAAARFGFDKSVLENSLPRIAELPFSSEKRRMTTVHKLHPGTDPAVSACRSFMETTGSQVLAFTKGAVDSLLQISTLRWGDHGPEPITPEWRLQVSLRNDLLAKSGMRVLGVAVKGLASARMDLSEIEQDLMFLGMIAMIDPPRPEALEAVRTCKEAGIRVVMITGDHPLTAQNIAQQVEITNGSAMTGQELSKLSNQQLEDAVSHTSVFARVSPEHKLLIIQALQKRKQIVAMTGDGVNDAPALKKADIGVAMGISGTDVAKEAADMVLLDDNFASIVSAVKEGRIIYDNIRKFVRYILTTNSGELWVMLFAFFLDMPLALLPIQILWINLVTDGLPALALSMEPAERSVMRRPPRSPEHNILGDGLGWHVLWVGLLMGILTAGSGFLHWRSQDPSWQTIVFLTLTLTQMAHVLAIRSEKESLFRIGLFSNKPLLGAVLLTFLLQVAVVYVPFLQFVFGTRSLSAEDFFLAITISATIFLAVETEKWIYRNLEKRQNHAILSSN